MESELITTVLVPLLGYVVYYVQLFFKARLAPKTLALIVDIAQKSVSAAEEVGRATPTSSGDKFEVAAAMLKASAKRTGLKLSPEEVTGYVHSALRDMRGFEEGLAELP